ncbi:MAG TPA: hypothetical protein VJB41_02990 [Patescibacteria group bacterium]|nr:hypothetical protein [Patescibacteria group bacterium]
MADGHLDHHVVDKRRSVAYEQVSRRPISPPLGVIGEVADFYLAGRQKNNIREGADNTIRHCFSHRPALSDLLAVEGAVELEADSPKAIGKILPLVASHFTLLSRANWEAHTQPPEK